MIRSVTCINNRHNSLKFELDKPSNSGYILSNIDGLFPEKVNILDMDNAYTDGSLYVGSRKDPRNIVITLIYMDQKDIEHARHNLYLLFPLKSKVKIIIETDERISFIEGYVESNEGSIFTKMESSKISILCLNPYFVECQYEHPVIESASPGAVFGCFHFPFSNTDLVEPTIILGSTPLQKDGKTDINTMNIFYRGEVRTGFVMTITLVRDVYKIHDIFINIDDPEILEPDLLNEWFNPPIIISIEAIETFIGRSIQEGDKIIIDSRIGSKSITYLSYDKSINQSILDVFDNIIPWFELRPGYNKITYSLNCIYPDPSNPIECINTSIEYLVYYEGV